MEEAKTIIKETEDMENVQLAENIDVEDIVPTSGEERRGLLKKTKIVKQTWSILEIYQKVQAKKLILDPTYQRNEIWQSDKRIPFVESLYMGIIIPPIYVVEIPGESLLEGASYEVVDGKQRLSTIMKFLEDDLSLNPKYLEYYQDCFANKKFSEIQREFEEETNAMLSSVLDIYVITANSPEFTKYDIFSRLNKGSEPLKVNEIRRAVYQSRALKTIDVYVQEHVDSPAYKMIFSATNIKRYDDYGRFFRSIAFYLKYNPESKAVVGYNSRPREMINSVLASVQSKKISIADEEIRNVLDATMQLMLLFSEQKTNREYLVDACIYFRMKHGQAFERIKDKIADDGVILETLMKSPSTTSNVNERFRRVHEMISGVDDE